MAVDFKDLTEADLDTLRHMLGWQKTDQRDPPDGRDYYCANPGDAHLARLEALDLVVCTRRAGEWIFCQYDYFTTTDLGKAMAGKSFYKRREKKSKRLYSLYLELRECWPDFTFHDFITSRDYDIVTARRNA